MYTELEDTLTKMEVISLQSTFIKLSRVFLRKKMNSSKYLDKLED